MNINDRVRRLEQTGKATGKFHWIDGEPGQTLDEAIAAYEAIHGPIGKHDHTIHWNVFGEGGRVAQ